MLFFCRAFFRFFYSLLLFLALHNIDQKSFRLLKFIIMLYHTVVPLAILCQSFCHYSIVFRTKSAKMKDEIVLLS